VTWQEHIAYLKDLDEELTDTARVGAAYCLESEIQQLRADKERLLQRLRDVTIRTNRVFGR
jgi:hypothetical protein